MGGKGSHYRERWLHQNMGTRIGMGIAKGWVNGVEGYYKNFVDAACKGWLLLQNSFKFSVGGGGRICFLEYVKLGDVSLPTRFRRLYVISK